MKSFLVRAAVAAAIAFFALVFAEEKNGLLLSVQKSTLDRADVRGGYYFTDRINRTQGLKATLKNVSFKPMQEGEMAWEILVRKYYSTTIESYKGTEKLKALRPAETAEMVLGAAQITGWRDGTEGAKDKIEWQVVVKQDGKEILRAASTGSFDTLAKRAVAAEKPKGR